MREEAREALWGQLLASPRGGQGTAAGVRSLFPDGQEESWSPREIYEEQLSGVWRQDRSSETLEAWVSMILAEARQMDRVGVSGFFFFLLLFNKTAIVL